MGMVAILVMLPGLFEQNFVPPSHGGSIWNLTLIGLAVSEDKMFKECGRRTDRWHTTEAYLSKKLTSEPIKMITIAQLTHFCVTATAKGDLFPLGKLIL